MSETIRLTKEELNEMNKSLEFMNEHPEAQDRLDCNRDACDKQDGIIKEVEEIVVTKREAELLKELAKYFID